MSEKGPNREVLERIAKEVLQAKTQEEIDTFVNTFVLTNLIN